MNTKQYRSAYKGIVKVLLFLLLASGSFKLLAVNITNEWMSAIWAYKQNNFEDALSHYNEILKVQTNDVMALIGKSSAYQNLNRLNEAFDSCNEAIKFSTNNISLSVSYNYRGYLHQVASNWNQAVDDYSKAVQYNPSSVNAYVGRAEVLIRQDMYAAAKADCNMALLLDPDSVSALSSRVSIFLKEGKYDKAIADVSRAIELESNSPSMFVTRGYAYCQKEDYKQAAADFTTAINSGVTGSYVYSARGLTLSKIGDFKEGINDCEKAVILSTNDPVALNNLAWLLSIAPEAKMRDGKRAVILAKKACEIDNWDHPLCLGTLAAAYAEAGDFSEAVQIQKKSIMSKRLPEKEMGLAHEMLNLFQSGKAYHAKQN